MKLSDLSIHAWIQENNIRNEKGEPIDFHDRLFLFDIFRDQSTNLTIMKAAQVGLTTTEILKNHYDAKRYKMDIIYTMPTDSDVRVMVGGKVNRIIANNPCMLADVVDKDSVEQKQVGESMVYFRGTWTKKAAIAVTADRLVHDEKDSSKLDVIAEYQARLQASKYHQTHTFSHPSLPEVGVHVDWMKSDQKHWFVKCEHCNEWQYLSWDVKNPKKMSVDLVRKVYICKKCHGVLSDETRRCGQWVAKYPKKEWSGYWVPLLIAPWKTAKDIVDKYQDKDSTTEFFMNKVIGLPYSDGTAKLLRQHLFQNVTGVAWAPKEEDRVVIGIDTGIKLDYVMGTTKGLFFQGEALDYDELDNHMARWPKAVAIIDQGGDLIGSRKFHKRWPGRVFLLAFGGEKKGMQLMNWGEGDEYGSVSCDRNRMIQLVVDEFREKRIPLHGTETDWFEYWNDWNNLSKMKVLDPDTNQIRGYKWIRNGRDHRALATVAYRVGVSRFNMGGKILQPDKGRKQNSYSIKSENKIQFDPEKMFGGEPEEDDWRL